jgi:thiol-disulfide isomerase/thioredoxin
MGPDGIILKAENFQISKNRVYINSNKINTPGMLLIWADYCSHCHRFIPTFNKIYKKIGNKISLASIESEELNGKNELVSALDFTGYPTIVFFDKNGLIINQYEGNRSEESILNEICKIYHHCAKYH